MRTFLLVAAVAVASVVPSNAEEKQEAPKSPPPDHVVLVSVDDKMGLAIYEQMHWEGSFDPVEKVAKYKSTKEQKTFSLAKSTFTEVGGSKPLVKDDIAKRLKPGVPLLLTFDGKGLDPYYSPVYKPGTLVVIVGR